MANAISILQFGTTGQLARALLRAAPNAAGVSIRALSRDDADLRFPEQVSAAVRRAGDVDLVINAAAYTSVDKAETEMELARTVNAASVAALARACNERGFALIHVSTDYVFDGAKREPYLETDSTNPLCVYGRTKLEGEDSIRSTLARHAIVRTSWLYSALGTNFVRTMLRLGAEREVLRVVDDQHGAPTSVADLASALLTIATRMAAQVRSEPFGTFHYSNGGETTWRHFAEAIFAQSSRWSRAKARIVPIATSEYPTAAHRPLNSRLDCTKVARVHGIVPPPWRESLAHVLDEIKTAQAGEQA